MLSGEDFSKVTEIKPMWYPDRPVILNNLWKAEDCCRAPLYFFGILFFFLITVLAFMLLDAYSAIFATAFFAFYPFLLQFSRWIHVDVIQYAFIAAGLIFLWKSYNAEKGSTFELLSFSASIGLFALAFATKLPAVIYLPFAFLLMLEKYRGFVINALKTTGAWLGLKFFGKLQEVKEDLNKALRLAIAGIISFFIFILPPFEFKLNNVVAVVQKYRATDAMQGSTIGSIAFNKELVSNVQMFLSRTNILDVALFTFALYIFVALCLKKKDTREKFIFALSTLFFIMLLIYPAMGLLRVFFTFSFGIIFLMALLFSDKPYGLLTRLSVTGDTRRKIFIGFIIVYVLLAASFAFSDAPYFEQRNQLICKISTCEEKSYSHLAESQLGEYLKTILINNSEDTFEPMGTHMVYYYVHPEQAYFEIAFREQVRQQIGRVPNAEEWIKYFHPNNLTIRYIPLAPKYEYQDTFIDNLKKNYEPNHKIILKNGAEAFWVYDLKNLQTKI